MSKVLVEKLEIGMLLGEDIIANTGQLLATKGETISENILNQLKKLNLSAIEIKDSNTEKLSMDERSNLISELSSFLREFTLLHYSLFGKMRDEISSVISKIMLDDYALEFLNQLKKIDDYTYNHAIQTGMISGFIAYLMEYDSEKIETAILSGIFHNIGKLAIDKNLLTKDTKLTTEELAEIKTYPLKADSYLNKISFMKEDIKMAIKQHHERRDGSGYPDGLKDDEICDIAKIVGVADEYDAAVSDKCYHLAISPFNASDELFQESLNSLDPEASQTLIRFLQKHYIGLKVELNTGEVGEVVFVNKLAPNRPLIKTNNDKFYDLSDDYSIKITAIVRE